MKKEPIETTLEQASASLTREQKNELWRKIEAETVSQKPIPSPYLFTLKHKKPMTPIIAALVLVLGLGGTAAAAENARPGDLLFPIDQAIEDVRLALATSDEAEARLKIAFAEERLAELRSLLEDDNASQDDTLGEITITQFEAEADVFTDTTIVKVEINDRKTTFETGADTKEGVIDEIVARFNVERATVEAVLDFEIEDRASRVRDLSGSVSSNDDRVQTSVTLVEELTGSLSDEDQARFVDELLSSFGNNARIEVRNDDDGDSRIEIRDGDTRIKIEEKDGEVEMRVREDDDSRDGDDDSNSNDSSGSSFEAEADVFTDTTIVKVEINDRKTTFETGADTKEGVIDEIVARFNVERATVEAVLDFEIEDRASRTDDSNDDGSRDSDEDSSDSSSSDDSDNRVRVEVKVEDGVAEVRLEYNGKRDGFETAYTNKSSLITLLANRSGLSESTISSTLDLEIKD